MAKEMEDMSSGPLFFIFSFSCALLNGIELGMDMMAWNIDDG